jgi:hypothetical protein
MVRRNSERCSSESCRGCETATQQKKKKKQKEAEVGVTVTVAVITTALEQLMQNATQIPPQSWGRISAKEYGRIAIRLESGLLCLLDEPQYRYLRTSS